MIAALAAVLAGLGAVTAAVGGWAWWQVRASRWFWPLLRAAQGAAILLALAAGVAFLGGRRPHSGLFWIYALVPVAVGSVAEQLRLLSAQTVLDARGIADAQELGRREEAEQRSVVLAIVRRETGIMALACAVAAVLALRALATSSGL